MRLASAKLVAAKVEAFVRSEAPDRMNDAPHDPPHRLLRISAPGVALLALLAYASRPARAAPPIPTHYPLAELRTKCPDFRTVKPGPEPENYRECSVKEFRELGQVDGSTYHYATYCLIPNHADAAGGGCGGTGFNAAYYSGMGMAVFAQQRGRADAELVFERAHSDIGVIRYYPPKLLHLAAGTVLDLEIAIDGTGAGNASEYFLRVGRRWLPIEAESWLKDLTRRLPADVELWKGVWPKLETMTAEVGLYHRSDANCCPTGGRAVAKLALRSRRIVLVSVQVSKDER